LVLLALFLLAAGFLWKVVLLGQVLLPADVLLLMTPWRDYARERFPDFREAQNGMFDPLQQYYPWRLFAVRSLQEGHLPLWNPYMLCGTPFLANLLSAVLYPPNLLFAMVPVGKGFGYSALLHLTLAGWGMFFFLREIGLRRGPAGVGAAAFTFNGFFVAWLEYPNVSLWVGSWLPWVLFLWERAWQRRSGPWLAAASLVLGLQFTGGHAQISFYVVLGFLLYALFRLLSSEGLSSPDPPPLAPRPPVQVPVRPLLAVLARYLLLPLALAGLLGAPQLLPSFEMAAHSDRQNVPLAVIHRNALPPAQLLCLYLLPNLFGNSRFHNLYWGNFNFIEMSGYVGVTTFLTALLTLPLFRRAPREQRAWAGFFWGLVGLCLLLALATPVYTLFFYLVPGFRQLTAPARILYLHAFAWASLAALGVAWLSRGEGGGGPKKAREGRKAERMESDRQALGLFLRATAAGLAFAIVLAMRFFADFFREERVRSLEWRGVGLTVLWAALTLALIGLRGRLRPTLWTGALGGVILLDLFAFGLGFNPTVPAEMLYFETPVIRYLRDHLGLQRMATTAAAGPRAALEWMPPNTQMVYGLRSIQGSDSLTLAQFTELVQACAPGGRNPDWATLDRPLVDLLGVRYILTPRELPLQRFPRVLTDRRTHLYANPQALPRAFTLPQARFLPDLAGVRAAMAAPDFDPRAAVLLEGEEKPSLEKGEGRGTSFPPVAFSLAEETPNRVTVKGTVSQPSGAWLVLSDTYYPGWRVYVDGRRQPLRRAYGTLRAVRLEAGAREVRFVYQPTSFRVGMFLALAAWGGMVGVGVESLRRRRSP